MPQKSLHSCSEKTDKLNLGLEDFAYALQNVIVTKGPIVRELPTQKRKKPRLDIWATFESQPMLHINLVLPNFFFSLYASSHVYTSW